MPLQFSISSRQCWGWRGGGVLAMAAPLNLDACQVMGGTLPSQGLTLNATKPNLGRRH